MNLVAAVCCIMFLFTNCEDDLVKEEANGQDSGIRASYLNAKEVNAIPEVLSVLNKIDEERLKSKTERSVYNIDYDLYVNKDNVLKITKGDCHSLTFPIYQLPDNGLTENLVLSLEKALFYTNKIHKRIIMYKFNLILILSVIFTSCNSQEVNINLTIYNKSGKTLDSLCVYDVFSKETKYYNVKQDAVIIKNYIGEKSALPKGESGVFTLSAFDKDYVYSMTNGFIGFPTARLELQYSFYIYDTYIAIEEGFAPANKDHRIKLEGRKN